MAEAYIKLYRKMIEWEWYDDVNTCRLFLHCLFRANWKAGSWHGIDYEPGQFITSLSSLATETHLTVQQVRTALTHLKSTGEITDLRQGNCRIITVNNWNRYQGDNRPSNKPSTNLQQTFNKPSTTDKEYKEREEGKEVKEIKHIYGEYKHVKLTDSQRDKLFKDYGEAETLKAIKYLDEYIQMKGYKAKDHNLCLRKWVFDAIKEKPKSDNVFDAWANA